MVRATQVIKRWTKVVISSGLRCLDVFDDSLRRLFGKPRRSRGVILYYHSVRHELAGRFGRQMDLLVRYARPWRVGTSVSGPPGLYVAVTFDDGYASVVENALPELRRAQVPFTVFFPTGSWNSRPKWIDKPSHPFWNERVIGREELKLLAQEPLVTIGSHSVSHPRFPSLNSAAAAKEFRDSKRDLEAVTGITVRLFCFPHGACDNGLVRQAIACGYEQVFTVDPSVVDPRDPQPVMGRIAVEPDESEIEFRLKMEGAYRWQSWFKPRVSVN